MGAAGGGGGEGRCFLFCAFTVIPVIVIHTTNSKIFFCMSIIFAIDTTSPRIHTNAGK
jgi:hypothetical protein